MTGCCANLKALSSHFSAILRMRSSSAAPLGVAAAVGLLGEAGILRPRPNRLERTSCSRRNFSGHVILCVRAAPPLRSVNRDCIPFAMLATSLAALAFTPATPLARAPVRLDRRCISPRAGQGDELGGAIGSTFGEMFASMFRPSAEKEAEIDRACARRVNVPRSACA